MGNLYSCLLSYQSEKHLSGPELERHLSSLSDDDDKEAPPPEAVAPSPPVTVSVFEHIRRSIDR